MARGPEIAEQPQPDACSRTTGGCLRTAHQPAVSRTAQRPTVSELRFCRWRRWFELCPGGGAVDPCPTGLHPAILGPALREVACVCWQQLAGVSGPFAIRAPGPAAGFRASPLRHREHRSTRLPWDVDWCVLDGYLKLITEEVGKHGTLIEQARAGYLLEKVCGLLELLLKILMAAASACRPPLFASHAQCLWLTAAHVGPPAPWSCQSTGQWRSVARARSWCRSGLHGARG